jgi:hypothetical protein
VARSLASFGTNPRRFAPRHGGSIFICTHEAHPWEYYPRLTSFEQKYRHAQALLDLLGIT